MSKYVKYISSDHYGAPELKGDRFGYTVEMLRKTLCEGFNERTDVTKIEIISEKKIEITFLTEHKYVSNQTIKMSGFNETTLNSEFVVIEYTPLSVICTSYIDLSLLVGTIYEDVLDTKTIVAPLGFIEKYKDGNRSAFTTDEEEAFLCIDDETPSNWDGALAVDRTPQIIPIVYMTDKKTDIDTDGRFIVPFSTTNPTWYKSRSYLDGTNKQNGIWNWISYGVNNASGNLAADRTSNIKYTIIGNGRMFYYIPEIQYVESNLDKPLVNVFYFGKVKSGRNNDLLYVLNSAPYSTGAYNYTKISQYNYKYALANYTSMIYTRAVDIGQTTMGILKVNNSSSQVIMSPTVINQNIMSISGSESTSYKINYPNTVDKKMYLSTIKVRTPDTYIGQLSGVLFIHNINTLYFNHGEIKRFGSRSMYTLSYRANDIFNGAAGTTSSKFTYLISLDYKDWYNYE